MKEKLTNEELKAELEAVKRTNLLIEKSPIVRFVWKNQKNWPVEYVSKNVKNIFGYTADDFMTQKIVYSKIIHHDDLQRVENEVSRQSENDSPSIEHEPYRIITKSKKIKWLKDLTFKRKNDKNEITHFEGIITDITEQKQTKQALEENELRWKFAIEGNSDGMWDWDLTTDKVFYSDQWKNLLGFSDNEISDDLKEWEKRVHSDDKEKAELDINNHIIGKTEYYKNEHRLLCKNNTYKWVLDKGKIVSYTSDKKPARMIGTLSDITDRKKTEHALKESEDLLKEAQKLAKIGHWIYDVKRTPDKIFWDENSCEIHDMKLDYFDQKPETAQECLHPDDKAYVLRTFQTMITQKKSLSYNTRIITKKSVLKHIHVICRVILNDNGDIEKIKGIFQDVTESKIAVQALKESEETLKEAQKLAKIGHWIYDLKNPDKIIWDENLCEIHDIKFDEFDQKTKTTQEFLHPDDSENFMFIFQTMIAQKKAINYDLRIITKKGVLKYMHCISKVILNDNGDIDKFTGIIQDVTESKKAEKVVRENEKIMRIMIENSSDGIAILNEGQFVFANTSFSNILDYSVDELEKIEFQELMSEGSFVSLNKDLKNCREIDDPPIRNEIVMIKKNGKKIDIDVSIKNIKLNDEIVQFCQIRDITKQKEIMELLNQGSEQTKGLKEFIHICAGCSLIQDDEKEEKPWVKPADYISERLPKIRFSHAMCPDCIKIWYSDFIKMKKD